MSWYFITFAKASAALNDIFSIPVLLILTLKFMMIVGAAFAYIYSFYHSNNILENARCYIGFTFLTECVRILVVLTAADLPVIQVMNIYSFKIFQEAWQNKSKFFTNRFDFFVKELLQHHTTNCVKRRPKKLR
jgi:hypothetical protein